MKIKVDHVLALHLFGQRTPRTDSPRFYYQAVGYDCLIVVFHEDDYVAWRERVGVALFNFDQVNGRIICELFPRAPARWRDEPHLIQITVRRVKHLPEGRAKLFSHAVVEMIGESC